MYAGLSAANKSTAQHKGPSAHVTECTEDGDRSGVVYRWKSNWLRLPFLSGLIAMIIILGAALLVLQRKDQLQQGFAVSFTSTHYYAWTYGPTAVFVITASLWRQVDYQCKVMQPWTELSRGLRGAHRSVLLDYITPFSVVSFAKAIRFMHLPVMLSIAGYAVLKLAVLFSTGLLILTPTTLSSNISITLTTDFAYTKSLRNTVENDTYGNFFSEFQDNQYFLNINSTAAYAYYSVLTNVTDEPEGMAGSDLYQVIKSEVGTHSDSLSAIVKVLRPEMSCEVAQIGPAQTFLQLESASCTSQLKAFEEYWHSCVPDQCPPSAINYYHGRVNCSTEWVQDTFNETHDLRYAFMVARYTYDWTPPGLDLRPYTTGHRQEVSAVICKANYSVGTGTLQYDSTANTTIIVDYESEGWLGDFTGFMIGEVAWDNILLGQGFTWNDTDALKDQMPWPLANNMFYMILRTMPEPQTLDHLLHSDLLGPTVAKVFNGIAAHYMHNTAVIATTMPGMAITTYIEDRLRISPASFWIVLTSLSLLLALSIGLIVVTARRRIPGDPSRISTHAKVLANSKSMEVVLRNAGSLSSQGLYACLNNTRFALTSENHIVVAHNDDQIRNSTTPEKHTHDKVWLPPVARWYMLYPTILLPLLLIIALEVVFGLSLSRNGIIDVTSMEITASTSARYITALVMLLIATLLNALDFTISLQAPYGLLCTGAIIAQNSIDFQILGELPLVALWKSLRSRHYSSASSNLAALLASLLAVAGSGLWTVDSSVIVQLPVQAALTDSWDIAWQNSSLTGDGGAADYLVKLYLQEASMPPQIWDGFVIPNIAGFDTLAKNYIVQIPALRPVLDCSFVGDQDISLTSTGSLTTAITARPSLTGHCQRGGQNGTLDHYTYGSKLTNMAGNNGGSYDEWLGMFEDLHLGPWPGQQPNVSGQLYDSGDDRLEAYDYQDNPAGCPSIGVVFAHYMDPPGDVRDNFTFLLCSQKIEQAVLSITYESSDAAEAPCLSRTTLPTLINGTQLFVTNGTPGIDSFPYRVETYLDTLYDALHYQTDWMYSTVDPFINYILLEQDGSSQDALAGRANREAFMESVQDAYVKYISLVIHLKFRQPFTAELSPSDQYVNGTATVQRSRLQVNFTSKVLLQTLLGVMTFLGFVAFMLADLRSTLPREPSSIASVMALLAGSDLCNRDVASLFDHSDGSQSEKRALVAKSCRFSLGWWSETALGQRTSGGGTYQQSTMRFGIDAGMADELGYRRSRWSLRKRLPTRLSIAPKT